VSTGAVKPSSGHNRLRKSRASRAAHLGELSVSEIVGPRLSRNIFHEPSDLVLRKFAVHEPLLEWTPSIRITTIHLMGLSIALENVDIVTTWSFFAEVVVEPF